MEFIDYYKELEISKTASKLNVKKAYSKLASKYRPDLNPNNKEPKRKFKELNEANEVLSHKENRIKNDKYGEHWKNGEAHEQAQNQRRRSTQHGTYSNQRSYAQQNYLDFFESMFSVGEKQRPAYSGEDYTTELQLELLDVLKDHKRTLTVSGKNIRITIPAGVTNGQTIKINNHGDKSSGYEPTGDLFITFIINNNTVFHGEQADLLVTQEIPLLTAVFSG
jgi:curved DNA-binding protein